VGWERVIQAEAPGPGELPGLLEALFADQRARWPAFAAGEHALARLQSRTLEEDGARLVLQVNPGRRASTGARVEPEAIAARPCFLCPENMPPEERGVAFERLVVAPNPCPVLGGHATAAFREHAPQQLAGRLEDLLSLARAVGPGSLAFYNGPRCGASAPDHAHFQLVPAAGVPLFGHLPPPLAGREGGWRGWSSLGRRMVLGYHPGRHAARAHLERALVALGSLSGETDEPRLNLLVRWDGERYLSALFPRRVHRPARFFSIGPERLPISPAALEMAGLLVVVEPEHLGRVDADVARALYAEVGLDAERFAAFLEAMA
jgi:hypothetical protein